MKKLIATAVLGFCVIAPVAAHAGFGCRLQYANGGSWFQYAWCTITGSYGDTALSPDIEDRR